MNRRLPAKKAGDPGAACMSIVVLLRDAITQGVPHGLQFHNNPELESLRDYQPYVDLVRPIH